MTEDPIRVAYQGAPGAFSEDAAASYLGTGGIRCLPQREFVDVRCAVIGGAAEFGVLPIENSIHGPVTRSLAAFAAGGLEVIGKVTGGAQRSPHSAQLPITSGTSRGTSRIVPTTTRAS